MSNLPVCTPASERSRALAVASVLVAIAGLAAAADGQWADNYSITRLGFFDAAHTGAGGIQSSNFDGSESSANLIYGRSTRYNAQGSSIGSDSWVWTPTVGVVQVGLTAGSYTSSSGTRRTYISGSNSSGVVVGYSDRFIANAFLPATGAWCWTAATGQVQLSYGPVSWFSRPVGVSEAGQVAGLTSHPVTDTILHSDAWVWTQAGGYTRIGLTSSEYTTAAGYRVSVSLGQNTSGQVAGYSSLATEEDLSLGQDVWVYRPGLGSVRVNPVEGNFTGQLGYRRAELLDQNESGVVAGTSVLIRNNTTDNGQATWVWSAQDGTQRVGLTTSDHTGLNGRQYSEMTENSGGGFVNAAGYASGISTRYNAAGTTIGQNAWLYGPGIGTVQVGLTDALHTSANGTQISSVYSVGGVSLAGQAIGVSTRYTGGSGQDAWVRTPQGDTYAIGLTGAGFTGSAGYQVSEVSAQNESGVVVGSSTRISGVSTSNGTNAWAWSSSTGTVPIGLSGAAYTGSDGYQNVAMFSLGGVFSGGQVAGSSSLVSGVNVIGSHTWVWNAATGTVQTGLRDAAHTGVGGVQASYNVACDTGGLGVVVGSSARYNAAGASLGSDAWYFDAVTQNTYQPTLGVANTVRTSDGLSFNAPLSVTPEGVMFGQYLLFMNGQGAGVQHQFLYRPDLGFVDVNDLVTGGLAGSGWASLVTLRSLGQDTQMVFFGSGVVLNQNGGTSLYAMTVPAPSAAVFPLAGLALMRRPRR